MRRLAIIPARGGSKRLPRKNIAEFSGRPIIAWTISAANHAQLFDRVVVSTEDAEIAEIARRYGAEVEPRRADLATDSATVVDVCLDLLEREDKAGCAADILCCLYATAPLRAADDIRATIALIEPGVCDFAMAVTGYDVPPYQALRWREDGTLEPMWPELINLRQDQVGELVVDNGSTYAASVSAFRRHRSFYGPGLRGHRMPRIRSIDIDTPEDLELARYFSSRVTA
jgi:CMP-N-acetylneuraminic acid synthetase